MSAHFIGDTAVLTRRSLRHILRSPDTIITTAVTPIALMLLFVYVFGGAIDTGSLSTGSYIDYMLPGILLITIASGIAYTAYRLFLDMQGGIFERFQSLPIARSGVLWAHVLTSLVSILVSLARRDRRGAAHGLPHGCRLRRLAGRDRHARPVHGGAHVARGDRGTVGEDGGRRECVLVPADLPARSSARRSCRPRACPGRCSGSPRTSRSPRSSTRCARCSPGEPVGSDIWVAMAWLVGILVVAYVDLDVDLPQEDQLIAQPPYTAEERMPRPEASALSVVVGYAPKYWLPSALLLRASNSPCEIVPASSSAFAFAMSSAGLADAPG